MKTFLRILAALVGTLFAFCFAIDGAAFFFAYKYQSHQALHIEKRESTTGSLTDEFSGILEGIHTVAEWPSQQEKAFTQAPALDAHVASGKLPPVAERLPRSPLVVVPPEQPGPYGGKLLHAGSGPSDIEAGCGYLMTEGLLKRSPDGNEFWPNLADKWEMGSGGAVFRFKLRAGVRWSDGEPLTTDDIEFWYEHILHNNILTPSIPPALKSVEGENFELEVHDAWSFTIRFPSPNPGILLFFAEPYPWLTFLYPRHYLKQFHPDFTRAETLTTLSEAEGYSDWSSLFLKKSQYHLNPECPTLRAWIVETPPPATLVRFGRNPYYWKVDPAGRQLPYIDTLETTVIDAGATELAAQYGKLDFQHRGLGASARLSLLRNAASHGYTVRPNLEPQLSGIAFNLNSKNPKLAALFAECKFKQAMSMGFDRKALIEAFDYGRGRPFQAGYLPSSPDYREADATAYTEYDPHRANMLLDELQLTRRDSGGFRTFADGSPMVIYFEVPSTSMKGGHTDPRLQVCDYWRRELGINVVFKPCARGLFYARDAAGLIDINQAGGTLITPGARLSQLAPTSARTRWCPAWNQWFLSKGTHGQAPPPLLQELAVLEYEYSTSADPDRQRTIARRLLDVNREHLWVIGMYLQAPGLTVVSQKLRNVPKTLPPPTRLATEIWSKDP